MSGKKKAAIIGSGNIGTDLLIKIMRTSKVLEPAMLVGVDPNSDGLARAARLGVKTTAAGIDGFLADPVAADVDVVFDATSARAHVVHAERLKDHPARLIDLTPAALGPFVVPAVNLAEHLETKVVNMVTCGGQATIPIVAAVTRAASSSAAPPVLWAEIVASIASKSAGPGTRANIDEFTTTTATALERVGGAQRGKAIIVLNPAEPPVIMRDTVICVVEGQADEGAIDASIRAMVDDVARYVPGYRLVKPPVFDAVTFAPPGVAPRAGTKVSVFLEVEGAAHYLPAYAGNLDIMTSAALRLGEGA